ncbi:hypothetical protein BSL82_14065 [Tardibacter chloracetimidivorans]|uniref:Uncharacterized protein n=1 Tax=Tardibacter chloracetimidivorans TaxID=1921510 RepID=A0A1L3ZXC1_9SPHN|nr:hypothetical protein BSL82_14065 [Tardibacter chloracetimidivorans]
MGLLFESKFAPGMAERIFNQQPAQRGASAPKFRVRRRLVKRAPFFAEPFDVFGNRGPGIGMVRCASDGPLSNAKLLNDLLIEQEGKLMPAR